MKAKTIILITKRILSGLLILFWMWVIVSFSAQEGPQSANVSKRVASAAVTVEETIRGTTFTPEQRARRIESLQFPVRKAAHASIYAVLGVLLFWHLHYYRLTKLEHFLLVWLLLTFFAIGDEIHQMFVPGRDGNPLDVAIDSTGGLIGILFAGLVRRIFSGHKRWWFIIRKKAT